VSSKATAKRAAIGAAAVSSSAAAGAAGAALGAAAYFARRVLTPDRRKPDDCEVLSTATDSVVLAANAETVVPGRYGLWLDGSRGHIRIGEILDRDEATVRRRIEAQDFGIIRPGPARWNG